MSMLHFTELFKTSTVLFRAKSTHIPPAGQSETQVVAHWYVFQYSPFEYAVQALIHTCTAQKGAHEHIKTLRGLFPDFSPPCNLPGTSGSLGCYLCHIFPTTTLKSKFKQNTDRRKKPLGTTTPPTKEEGLLPWCFSSS